MKSDKSALDAEYELLALSRSILNGKMTQKKTKMELARIRDTYGNPFLPWVPERKPKPWTMSYLRDIEKNVKFGAISPEYLSYLSEIADEVYRPQRILKWGSLIAGIAVLFTILSLIIWRK